VLLATAVLAVARALAPAVPPQDVPEIAPAPIAPGAPPLAASPPAPYARAAPQRVPGARDDLLRAAARALRERLDEARRAPRAAQSGHRARVPEISSARAVQTLDAAGLLRRAGPGVEVAGVTHTRYRLTKQGLPLFNASGILSERDGALVGRAGRIQIPPLAREPAALGKAEAIAAGLRAARAQVLQASPVAEPGWFALPGATVPAWKVVVPAARPFGAWQVVLDARSGRTLALVDLVRSVTGVGSVYDPNKALAPTPSDVPLLRLDGSGRLQGDIVRVFDARALAAFSPSEEYRFPENDTRFPQVAVYRGVTDTGIFAEEHGFPPFAEALLAYTNLADPLSGGEYNNAYYNPFFRLVAFGNGDGVVTSNLGTDLDVSAHETGHHVFEVLVQPEILSSADPVLAMSEGVADSFAALLSGDPDIGESTIPGEPYLRTLSNQLTFPGAIDDDPHLTGLVYGGANWQMIQHMGADAFSDLLIAALARLPSDPWEFEYRDAFLQANLDVRGGADQGELEAIFAYRGFDQVEFPPQFEGYLEDGLPQSRFLSDSPSFEDPNFHIFVFSEFPGSTSITFNTSGSGDVDLFVVSLDDPNPEPPFASSEGPGSSEQVTLSQFSSPSVNDGDAWGVFVFDYPDGSNSSYQVGATATLPPANLSIGGAPLAGSIDAPGGYEIYSFQAGFAGQVVRVEVEALDETLDPLVAVLDPRTFEVLGVDDDSGPGLDSLIQGAQLPQARRYALVVVSLTADVDPTVGTGAFEVRLANCANSGPNADGDALSDVCDDDDDDDTFFDSEDTAPLDPDLCADLDRDGCDDCSSGDFDPFADGPDADTDGLCDTDDPDDDNDGCTDGADAAPLQPSADDDLDFRGADCDSCPSVANTDQADADGDGVGDSCDNCVMRANPRDTGGGAAALFSGNQLDSDQDGHGNACDADFNQSLPVVGFPDLTQMRQALGKDRDANDCPQDDGSPGGPCAEFDLDGNLPVIGFPDLVRFRQLLGLEPGPKCQACPLPNLP
jgi:hypothetical protein